MEVTVDAQDRGKCSTCGFLSKHCSSPAFPTPRFYEIDEGERLYGNAFSHIVPGWGSVPTRPSCFMRVKAVVPAFESAGKNSITLQTIFREPRGCSQWYEYIPGMSPQEHWQDLRMNELELRREAFEQKMDKDHKEFILRMDERNRTFQWWVTAILGMFALVEAVAAFVQVAFPNGWPWLMRILGSYPEPPLYPPM